MITFKLLSPGFGVEAAGVDLSQPLSDADFAALERAFYAHQVLALRAQNITATQFGAFARRIGPPQPHVIDQFHHPEDSNILILSNVKKDGQPTGLQDAGSYFHTDYSYLQVPARATTLYSRVVPKVGGDTLFANQQAAYDDLPDAMKKRIEPLYAIHHYGNRNDQDEKSRTRIGQHAEMGHVPVAGAAVMSAVLAHGRDDDPVGEVDLSQPNGREECTCHDIMIQGRKFRRCSVFKCN